MFVFCRSLINLYQITLSYFVKAGCRFILLSSQSLPSAYKQYSRSTFRHHLVTLLARTYFTRGFGQPRQHSPGTSAVLYMYLLPSVARLLIRVAQQKGAWSYIYIKYILLLCKLPHTAPDYPKLPYPPSL